MIDWKNTNTYINEAKSILLTMHENPDGDGLGSATAMYHYLKEIDKDCRILNVSLLPIEYDFLNTGNIIETYSPDIHDSWIANADLAGTGANPFHSFGFGEERMQYDFSPITFLPNGDSPMFAVNPIGGFIPLILGFIIPVSVLLNFVLKGYAVVNISEVVDTAITSISISFVASTTIMLLSFLMVVVATYKSNTFQKSLIFLASCGYAFPGTILAVGVVVFVGCLNDIIYFHMSYFIGGFLVLIFAYTLRFLAIGNGSIRSGITRINPNLIDASRTMGRSFLTTMKKLILPLAYTNILVGGILVFVDILKELPITLLLRPFNFETLATYVYQYASDEMLEESSFAALIIVLAGLGPVIFLSRTIKNILVKQIN